MFCLDAEKPAEDEMILKKKPKHDEFLNILQMSDQREHDLKLLQMEFEKKRLEMQEKDYQLREREVKGKEERDVHQREMDNRKMKLEEEKLQIEKTKTEADVKEKNMLLELLLSKLK